MGLHILPSWFSAFHSMLCLCWDQGNPVKKTYLNFGGETFIFFSHSAWTLVGGIKSLFPIRKTLHIGIHRYTLEYDRAWRHITRSVKCLHLIMASSDTDSSWKKRSSESPAQHVNANKVLRNSSWDDPILNPLEVFYVCKCIEKFLKGLTGITSGKQNGLSGTFVWR